MVAELRQKLIKSKRQSTGSLLFKAGILTLFLSLGEKQSSSITVYEQIYSSLIVAVFILSLIKLLINKNVKIPKTMFYWILFGCLSIVNVLLAISNGIAVIWWFRRFFPIFSLFAFAIFAFAELKTLKKISIIYIILILLGVFNMLSSLMRIPFNNISAIYSFQSIRKFAGGYYTAFTLSLIFPFLFYYNKHYSGKFFVYLVFGIALIGLLLSFTRTYWIGSFVSLSFALYLLSKDRHKRGFLTIVFLRIIFSAIIVVTALVVLLWFKNKDLFVSLIARFDLIRNLKSLSFQDRLSEIKGIIDTMLANPLTILGGSGLGAKFTFHTVNPFRTTGGSTGWLSKDYCHNYYMYLFFHTGALGLFLFLAGWASLIATIVNTLLVRFRSNSDSDWIGKYFLVGIVTTIINLLVVSLTGPPLADFLWGIYFGLIIGSGLNLVKISQVRLKRSCHENTANYS